MDLNEILHRFFSVLPNWNKLPLRLIVSNPVSRTKLAGVVLVFDVEILDFANRIHAKSRLTPWIHPLAWGEVVGGFQCKTPAKWPVVKKHAHAKVLDVENCEKVSKWMKFFKNESLKLHWFRCFFMFFEFQNRRMGAFFNYRPPMHWKPPSQWRKAATCSPCLSASASHVPKVPSTAWPKSRGIMQELQAFIHASQKGIELRHSKLRNNTIRNYCGITQELWPSTAVQRRAPRKKGSIIPRYLLAWGQKVDRNYGHQKWWKQAKSDPLL